MSYKFCDGCYNNPYNNIIQPFIDPCNSNKVIDCDYCGLADNVIIFEYMEDFIKYILDEIVTEDYNGDHLYSLLNKDFTLPLKENAFNLVLNNIHKTEEDSPTFRYKDEIIDIISFWSYFKNDIIYESRYIRDFNEFQEKGIDSFFNQQVNFNKPLYRARINKNGDLTCNNMGLPPVDKASSGRANPEGIPFLYLSEDEETTTYEVRPTLKDEITISKFKIKKEEEGLNLVDFINTDIDLYQIYLSIPNSNGNLLNYIKASLFKYEVSKDLSKPIRSKDSKINYIPTQFICEYIKDITNSDGILFKSSLREGGRNIVLFNDEKVECQEVSKYEITNITIETNKL